MIEEIKFLHSKLTSDEVLRIVLIRNDWEIKADKTDIIGEFNGMIRIVRSNGTITSINPDAIAIICTMKRRAYL